MFHITVDSMAAGCGVLMHPGILYDFGGIVRFHFILELSFLGGDVE
jgi:hypothetical protein